MSREYKVAVLGAGNSGMSLAGMLSLSGIDVSLVELPDYAQNLMPIRERGGIFVGGEYGTGVATPTLITTDVAEGIKGREVLMFCHPAYAHERFTRLCAPHLEADQLLVYISNFAALRMSRLLSEVSPSADVTLAETVSFQYGASKTGPNEVVVKRRKVGLPFATLPKKKLEESAVILEKIGMDLSPAKNCLETSINNCNPWGHVPGVILNAGWIEATKGDFSFYLEGRTQAVIHLIDAMDGDKMRVASALGLECVSNMDLGRRLHREVLEETGGSMYPEKYYRSPSLTPKSLDHRFLVEDMLYGVVPVASIGHELGIDVRCLDAVIVIGSVIGQRDFASEGLGTSSLGLEGLSAKRMSKLAEEGFLGKV